MNTRNVNVKTAAQESSRKMGGKAALLLTLAVLESEFIAAESLARWGCPCEPGKLAALSQKTIGLLFSFVGEMPSLQAEVVEVLHNIERLGRRLRLNIWAGDQLHQIPMFL